jgi:hypothetical protein
MARSSGLAAVAMLLLAFTTTTTGLVGAPWYGRRWGATSDGTARSAVVLVRAARTSPGTSTSMSATAPAAAATTRGPAQLAAFAAWCEGSGVKASVALEQADGGHGGALGLRATGDLKKGDVVAAAPFGLCFSAEGARKSAEIGRQLEEFEGWTGAAGLIAAQLMVERAKGAASKWAAWISVLPEVGAAGALDLPLFWPAADVPLLEGCSTRPISELSSEVDLDFEWLEENVFGPDRQRFPEAQFDRATWRWAVGIALSRSFFVDGATRLAPFIDFVNHDTTCTNEVGSGGAGLGGLVGLAGKEVRLVADRAYRTGEEVCVTYGFRSGSEYLEEYGFVPR